MREIYRFAGWQMDVGARTLTKEGVSAALTQRTLDVLIYLVRNAGRVVPKEELLDAVWLDAAVEPGNLTQQVFTIRKALGERAGEHRYIATLSGRGYSFVAELETAEPDPTPAPYTPSLGQGAAASLRPPRVTLGGTVLFALGLTVALSALVIASGRGRSQDKVRVRPFTSFPGFESDPAISPDGTRVAYTWSGDNGQNTDVYVQRIDGGAPVRMTVDAAADITPAWSPDGRLLAFTRVGSSTRREVIIVPAAGGPERRILTYEGAAKGMASGAKWLSSGRELVLPLREGGDSPAALFAYDIDSGAGRRLTWPSPSIMGDFSPAVSRDGTAVAFVRGVAAAVDEIHVLSLRDGTERRVHARMNTVCGLDWTPDGREIVFSSNRDSSQFSLWRVPYTGGEPEAIAPGVLGAVSPAMSPRGDLLIYARYSGETNIWRSLARSGAHTPYISSTRNEIAGQYSPDGTRVAYMSDRSGAFEIWVQNADGTKPTQLTHFDGPHTGTPRWSPDGKWLVFDSRPNSNPDIFVVPSWGGDVRRLTDSPAEDVVPSFSHDGHSVFFASDRNGSWQIWEAAIDGSAAAQITHQGGFAPQPSGDGRFVYYAKGRTQPGLWRVPAQGGDEQVVIPDLPPWGWFALNPRGLFVVRRYKSGAHVLRFDPDARTESLVASLDQAPPEYEAGFSIAPDLGSVLYTRVDQKGSDLEVLSGFRTR